MPRPTGRTAARRLAPRVVSRVVLGVFAAAGSLLAAADARAAGIRATVDRTEATLEDQIVLSLIIEGSQSAQPALPELPDFEVLDRGRSTQVQIANGRMSATVSFTYVLIPKKTGTFTLGAATVDIQGRTFASRPFTVKIVDAGTRPADSRDVFVAAEVSTREPYVGQQVVYTWRFFRRVQVAKAQLGGVDFPGFASEKLGDVREYETTVGGQRFVVSELRMALFPQEAGEHTLAGPQLTCDVLVQARGRGGIFDDFFGRTSAQTRVLRTPPVTLAVRPLPAAPRGYSGLVGSFDLKAKLSKDRLAVGDSATLELTVSGTGNAQMIGEPAMPDLTADFKVYGDKPAGSIDRDGAAISGAKTFRKALVPLRAGALTVPAVELTYFDPAAGGYRTAATRPLTLEVSPAVGREELRLTESVAPTTGKVAVKILADDILPLYKGLDAVDRGPFRGAGAVALWSAGAALPPLGFCALLLWVRRRERYRLDAGLRRRQTALREALAGLRRIEAGATRRGAAAELASRCLRGYVGDKLGIEGTALTAAEIDAALRHNGVGEEPARRTHELLDRFEAARYGGGDLDGGTAVGAGDLAATLEPLLRELERELGARPRRPARRPDRMAASALGLFVVLAPLAAAVAAALPAAQAGAQEASDDLGRLQIEESAPSSEEEPAGEGATDREAAAAPGAAPVPPAGAAPELAATAAPEELFVHANAAYEAGDYPRALALYGRLRDGGFGDGHLDYDLGNAYLRNGELGRAIASYLRAQAALPRDQDVRANLAFARKSAKDALAPPAPSPVVQTLFFWHFGLGRRELALAAIVCNLLFWGALGARLRRRRSEALRWAVIGSLLLLVAAAGSLAVHLLAPARVAVVVPQEVDVRSGTSTDTVVRFKLHAGTEVRALEQREGWLRIALPDGQQGWLPAEHAELVAL